MKVKSHKYGPEIRSEGMVRPAVIIGFPEQIFVRMLASKLRSRGFEVTIVHRRGRRKICPDGVRVLASRDSETPFLRIFLRLTAAVLMRFETIIMKLWRNRFRKAMGLYGYRVSMGMATSLINGISIAHLVRSLNPKFVFGHHVFYNGPATAFCSGFPKVIMPYSNDIYNFPETSPLAFRLIKFVLRRADLICPTSSAAASHISRRFGIPGRKVEAVSWGVDHDIFRKADPDQRKRVCEKYGLDPGAMIFMNVRRFKPAWGCEIALEVFTRLARENSLYHFVMLGGAGSEQYLRPAKRKIAEEGLAGSFTLVEGEIPLNEVAELMSVSEIFVSLMRERDMRAFGVIQAAAGGGAPVLSDQEEYRNLEKRGFKALFVNPEDIDDVLQALRSYIANPDIRKSVAAQNRKYILEYEAPTLQMDRLLGLINEVVKARAGGDENRIPKPEIRMNF